MAQKKLTPVEGKPGYYRRHRKGCANVDHKSKCKCSWVIEVHHRGKARRETYATFGEAREAKGKVHTGDSKPRSKVTFGEYFRGQGKDDSEGWIGSYAGRTKRGFEEETRIEYRRTIADNALPLWEDVPMVEIGPGDVRALWATMMSAGKSLAAMQKCKGALSPLFNTAIEDEIVPTNPVTGVRLPAPAKAPSASAAEDEDDEKGKALTRDELARFLVAVRERKGNRKRSAREEAGFSDWCFFFEFMVVTGLRVGEVIGLTWANVILGGEQPRIRVREQVYEGKRKRYLKSDSGKREIPLSAEWTRRMLEHRRDHYAGPESPVFASITGTPLRPSNIYRRVLAPAAIDAGLYVEVDDGKGGTKKKTAIAFHAMRHTCASFLFAEGRNIKAISEWLGHSDPAFTLRVYVHLLDEGLGEGLDLPALPTPSDPDPDLHPDPAVGSAA